MLYEIWWGLLWTFGDIINGRQGYTNGSVIKAKMEIDFISIIILSFLHFTFLLARRFYFVMLSKCKKLGKTINSKTMHLDVDCYV